MNHRPWISKFHFPESRKLAIKVFVLITCPYALKSVTRSYDIFEDQAKDIKESSLLLGSCRYLMKHYNNDTEVTLVAFSLNNTPRVLASQHHLEQSD